jgi:hypothetical protein
VAVISFSKKPEETWSVAGWAFRQVLDDVISQYPDDKEIAAEFEEAKTAYSGLIVALLEPSFGARITKAIQQVVAGILSGTIQSGIRVPTPDPERILEQYRQALGELLHAIPPESAK